MTPRGLKWKVNRNPRFPRGRSVKMAISVPDSVIVSPHSSRVASNGMFLSTVVAAYAGAAASANPAAMPRTMRIFRIEPAPSPLMCEGRSSVASCLSAHLDTFLVPVELHARVDGGGYRVHHDRAHREVDAPGRCLCSL